MYASNEEITEVKILGIKSTENLIIEGFQR